VGLWPCLSRKVCGTWAQSFPYAYVVLVLDSNNSTPIHLPIWNVVISLKHIRYRLRAILTAAHQRQERAASPSLLFSDLGEFALPSYPTRTHSASVRYIRNIISTSHYSTSTSPFFIRGWASSSNWATASIRLLYFSSINTSSQLPSLSFNDCLHSSSVTHLLF
jgi:hypothetical protein